MSNLENINNIEKNWYCSQHYFRSMKDLVQLLERLMMVVAKFSAKEQQSATYCRPLT